MDHFPRIRLSSFWNYIFYTWRIGKPFHLLLIGHFFLSCQWQWITPLLLTRIWRRDSAACVFPRGFLPVFGFYTCVNILNFLLVRRGLFDFIRYVLLLFHYSWLLEIRVYMQVNRQATRPNHRWVNSSDVTPRENLRILQQNPVILQFFNMVL